MIGVRSLAALATLFAAACAVAVPEPQDEWHTTLLKRQAPGTPAYACHLACGTAITLSRGADPCTDDAFLTDYSDCLACAGPDNINIWIYYGGTLTTAGTKCGLSTTPLSGSASTTSAAPVTESSTISQSSTVGSSTLTSPPASESTTTSSNIIESTTLTGLSTAPTTTLTTSAETASASPTVSTTEAPSITSHSAFSTGGSPTYPAGNSTSTTIPFTGGGDTVNGKYAAGFAVFAAAVFAAI